MIIIGIDIDPTASVENFLRDNDLSGLSIIKWIYPKRLEAKDYPNAEAEINELKKGALDLGVSEVLLFYGRAN